MAQPKSYRNMEEFEREVVKSQMKVGFSYDDLILESNFDSSDLLFDDQYDALDPDNYDEED